MAARVLDCPISLPQPSNITSLRFGLVRFYPPPLQTERHRTFTLYIRRYSGAIPGLLLLDQLTAGLIGTRRLQSVITPLAWACSIRRLMFHQMEGQLRSPFMTIGIILALMCWSIFTWHSLLIVALPGNPISGLLLFQRMPRLRHSRPRATCSAIILGSHKLRDQLCRQYRYGLIHEPAIPIRLSLARGLRLTPIWLQRGKPRENHSPKRRLLRCVRRLATLTATAKILNRSLLPGRTQTTSLRS